MKRKVLFFIESLAGGGAEKVLTTLVQHIDKTRFEVTVCVISGGGKYEQEVKDNTVAYHSILRASQSYHGIFKLWYVIKYHLVYNWLPMLWVYWLFLPKGNDVEVAFVEGFATKLLAASGNSNAKKIAWVHCDMGRDHWTSGLFSSYDNEYSCYKKYHQVITMSKTQAESFRRVFPEVRVKVCYNPIDSSQIIELSKHPLVISSQSSDTLRFVSTGRLAPVKAFDRLLRITTRLLAEGFTFELWILGEGSERTHLEQYILENNLGNCVKLLGFQSNPYKYITQCDLFVCSSVSEGFSTAITEALILGVPVVSTEVSGVKEQLTNGCGIITENDEDALYLGIKNVLVHPEKLKQMKENAAARGKDFRIESLMKEIEAVLS